MATNAAVDPVAIFKVIIMTFCQGADEEFNSQSQPSLVHLFKFKKSIIMHE